jgi:hypothetical protein
MGVENRTITKQERDRLLDELQQEVKFWAQQERREIERKAEFLKKVLKARAGAGKVVASNIARASKLTAISVNNLLGIVVAEKE